MKKYTTGITVLDSSLGGGIPAGSLVLLVEKPGAGAEIISFQFAVEGVKKGESVLYVTTDETSENLLNYIKLYFPDFNVNENFQLISFISNVTSDAKNFIKSSMHDPLGFTRKVLATSKYDRIVINNLNNLIRNYGENEVISLFEELSRKVKNDESVALAILVEGATESRIENTLKAIADGILELDVQERKRDSEKTQNNKAEEMHGSKERVQVRHN
ncbi:RAD55 family ATPase [Archaeoglobus profundus]|uniref:RecA-superfamily ATPase implicated in signal transduction-like protein n=1 Tax=Archaeoglobus profundus (strain DSM 5631 / JCM 9629 / NBRC 100127 / Av18) TaxID=572546 RepID=D2RH39_ARCPA|nr:RAD55 family ATPase [Archaeoglobus profundus]ADB57614.1 RecA-superfamily ATPase implicated in signal transduction-like protein [Archaeoglobus profundus DSM 5631]